MSSSPSLIIAIRRLFDNRPDLFGRDGLFQTFEPDDADSPAIVGRNSSIVRGRIRYKRDGQQCRSPSLFVKVGPAIEENSCMIWIHFANETFFYSRALPFFRRLADNTIDSLFARFYDINPKNGSSDTDSTSATKAPAIVLEDLIESGYRTCDRQSYLDYEHLSLMARKLGEFHAHSYKAKYEYENKFYSFLGGRPVAHVILAIMGVDWVRMCGERAVHALRKEPKYARQIERMETIMQDDRLQNFFETIFTMEKQRDVAVLCHGDYLVHNLLFKYDDDGKPYDMRMIDLGMNMIASPVLDLVMIVYINADQSVRDERWDDLIDDYYDSLVNCFAQNKVPSKENILGEFHTRSLYAYFVAAYHLQALLVHDLDLPPRRTHLPVEYQSMLEKDIPKTVQIEAHNKTAGKFAESGVENVLRDMLDRGFV